MMEAVAAKIMALAEGRAEEVRSFLSYALATHIRFERRKSRW